MGVKITNGEQVIEVNPGAYESIYRKQGFYPFVEDESINTKTSLTANPIVCNRDCTRCSQIAATCPLQPKCKFNCTHCSQIAATCPIRNDGDKALNAKPVESALADYPNQIQAAIAGMTYRIG